MKSSRLTLVSLLGLVTLSAGSQAGVVKEEPSLAYMPAGSGAEGSTTGVSAGCGSIGGAVVGFRVSAVKPSVTRLWVHSYNDNITYYDGPAYVGLVVNLPMSSYVWTAFARPGTGNDYGAVTIHYLCES